MATETEDCGVLVCCEGTSFTYTIEGGNDRVTEDEEARFTESGEQRVIE